MADFSLIEGAYLRWNWMKGRDIALASSDDLHLPNVLGAHFLQTSVSNSDNSSHQIKID
jgi:hypothetical protein